MVNIETIKNKPYFDILIDAKEKLLELFGSRLKELILYGSYARNEQGPDSDIDIMALVDMNETVLRSNTYKVADIMTALSLKYDIFISISEETCERYREYLDVLPFYRNIHNEGLVIYYYT